MGSNASRYVFELASYSKSLWLWITFWKTEFVSVWKGSAAVENM